MEIDIDKHELVMVAQRYAPKTPWTMIPERGDMERPLGSPDFTPPTFFFWGYLKSNVYASKPQNIDELKVNIRVERKN